MNELTTQPGKNEKRKMQVVQQIFHNLTEVVELYPQYTIAQHLASITRRKDVEGKEFYYWNNDDFLKRIEQHKDELEKEKIDDEFDAE